MLKKQNLFDVFQSSHDQEMFELLVDQRAFKLERIISTGQSTPQPEWLNQDRDEWVVLLTGRAVLRFADDPDNLNMEPGDWIHIPAGCRHRVEKTAGDTQTIWLALHYLAD